MSAIVDYEFYSTVYMGQEVDEASFPALCARAEDVVGAMTRWAVTVNNIDQLHAQLQTLYRKAICAQADHFALNGLDSVAGSFERGWTVGKVSMSGKSGNDLARSGAMSEHISPLAIMYLEQTGLLGRAVAVAPDMPLTGGWL